MFAPVRCCFDVMFLLFASLFALIVHQALGLKNLVHAFFSIRNLAHGIVLKVPYFWTSFHQISVPKVS